MNSFARHTVVPLVLGGLVVVALVATLLVLYLGARPDASA